MGALLGLVAGVGLFLSWWSCWQVEPRARPVSSAPVRRLREQLAQADLASVSPGALLGGACGLGMFTFVLVLALCRVPAIAVCFASMAAWAPVALVKVRARRRRSRLRELWPDVVDNIASGIRAGLSLPEALAQLGERGPEALRSPFAEFGRDYRASGRFGPALDALKERLADPVADRICEALRLTREVGGSDLGHLLRTLSGFLRHDARTRAELEARQSWTVNAARLAVAAPWLILALMATRPEAVSAYARPAGAVVLGVGAGVTLLAYRVMLRVGRLPEEARVLA